MPDLLYYSYFYRYRQKRINVKALVDSLDYAQANTDLSNDITEQESFYPNVQNENNFNFGENIAMKHSLAKILSILEKGDTEYIEGDLENLPVTKHVSDRLKLYLLHIPKTDYTDTDPE